MADEVAATAVVSIEVKIGDNGKFMLLKLGDAERERALGSRFRSKKCSPWSMDLPLPLPKPKRVACFRLTARCCGSASNGGIWVDWMTALSG